MRHVIICLILLWWCGGALAQPASATAIDTLGAVIQVDRYDDAAGYYVYLPVEQPEDSLDLVLFLHGYGAMNPMIFGKWIEHLVATEKYCVVYPRYQMTLFQPSPQEFVPNTVEAVHRFVAHAQVSLPVRVRDMYMIGHSYGGVIAANIAARHKQYQLPVPRVAFVCQPGTGPFTGGVLESYAEIDPDILLAVMVGANDATVGQEFGRSIYESAEYTANRLLIWQHADSNGSERIDASHYEPYSLDQRFDNGISNFTSNKAERVSRLDQVDFNGYWKIFDVLIASYRGVREVLAPDTLEALQNLGEWPDGKKIRPLDIDHPGS